MTLIRTSFLVALVVAVNSAWSASPGDSFEAASVKLSASQAPVQGAGGLAPPIPSGPIALLTITHATLHGIVFRAWPVRRVPLITGPSWIDSAFYDVSAKVPPGASRQKIAEMLQNLLIERFDMRVHWDTKLANGWALVAGPPPLKLKRTSLHGEPTDADPDGVPGRSVSVRTNETGKTVVMNGASMQDLANTAWAEVGEPVQDLTGLKGAYDVTLEGDTDGPATFMSPLSAASLKKSLHVYGLDLIRQKVEVKTLIVDSATRVPKPN